MAPYLTSEKIRVDVTDIDLQYENTRMFMRTSYDASEVADSEGSASAFEDVIGTYGIMIKEHMR